MKLKLPDIDIDVADRSKVLENFDSLNASLDGLKKHNTGVYFTDIPVNPITNTSSIDYKEAEDRGYFKLDILNVSLYKDIKSEEHLNTLLGKEPLWELLAHEDFVEKVFHLNGHDKLLKQLKPQSVEQLAATLAIIRPAKRYLANKPWPQIMKEVWIKPNDGSYYFKKAHAVAYAMSVVVHMNLLCE